MAKIAFTAGRVSAFTCPADKKQAFLWDATTPGLGLRATPKGKSAYIFQGESNGKTVRITIGSPAAWTIEQARTKAREHQRQIDEGRNPAEVKRSTLAAEEAERQHRAAEAEALLQRQAREAVTVSEAWQAYLEERRPHWGARNYADHLKLAQAGGEKRKRMPGAVTTAGPLAELMAMRLLDLTPERVELWAAKEAQTRPARLRLAMRQLKAFLRWCSTQPDYRTTTDAAAASSKKARETAGRMKPKSDVLQREQLEAWFAQVQQLQNPVISAYLQCLLLTGARREELGELRWEDINFRWKGMSLGDKIEGTRQVPLTAYVESLIAALPRRNEWVFSSPASKSGRMVEPSIAHRQACAAAGLELTLHGLRRSFGTLSEWLEIPAGVVAQIQGHKPSATAEKHYRVRPLDLLRVHHQRIEAWMLEQAGIEFKPAADSPNLRVVSK